MCLAIPAKVVKINGDVAEVDFGEGVLREVNLALVEATPKGFQVAGSFQITMGRGPHWSQPVIQDGVLYIRHGDVLMAYDVKR